MALDPTDLPTIHLERCSRCGHCKSYCPTHAVELDDDGWPRIRRPETCAYCGICEETCPDGAIELAYEITWAQTRSV
jgi:formate hydrogenlyase subunit 6/NADH:ubiquinone oxidoreductase subunit I